MERRQTEASTIQGMRERKKDSFKEQRGQTILGCIEGKRMASSCGNQRPVGVHVHSLMIRSKSSTSTVSSIMYYVCNRLYSKKLESVVFFFCWPNFPLWIGDIVNRFENCNIIDIAGKRLIMDGVRYATVYIYYM